MSLSAIPSKMLVVDDEPVVQAALRKYFTSAGYDVDCAAEVEEAEALVATGRYDVVIADLNLSWDESEGLQVLRFVRLHSPATPVVILTGSSSIRVQHGARELGADAFMVKPALLPHLEQMVHRVMEARA